MKKFILLGILFLSLSGRLLAQSDVTVFCQDGQKFWLIINGIKQNDTPQTNVKVSGLTATNYQTKIIFENNMLPAIEKMIYTRDVDGMYYSQTYNIKKDKNGKYVLRLNSVDENYIAPQGGYTTQLWVEERPTNVQTSQSYTTTTVTNTNPNDASLNVNAVDPVTGEAINLNMNVNVTGVNANTSVTHTTTTTTTTTSSGYNDNVNYNNNQSNHYVMQGYNGRIGCPWPMNQGDFQTAKNSIKSKSFDDTRLTIAKQIISSNCLFCSQVKEIMLLFSFEATRLDFAKFAFPYVYDQGNYFQLNDAFTFESSIDELNQYINGR